MQHVLDGRETIHQVVVLEDHGDLRAHTAQLVAAQARDVLPVKDNRPLRGLDKAIDATQKRRLAGARRADHRDKLPLTAGKIHAGKRVMLLLRPSLALIAFGQTAHLQKRLCVLWHSHALPSTSRLDANIAPGPF